MQLSHSSNFGIADFVAQRVRIRRNKSNLFHVDSMISWGIPSKRIFFVFWFLDVTPFISNCERVRISIAQKRNATLETLTFHDFNTICQTFTNKF